MNKAFTLIEILIAIFVLSAAILSAFALFSLTLKGNVSSKNLTLANNLAQAKIEESISFSYDDLINIPRQSYNNDFDWQITIELMTIIDNELQTTETDQGLKKITATIYWQEKGIEKNKSLNMLKARH
tara:strand:- start:1842 stop:2225 length:384 start_codon:yes stop_codon:yes gene_type:complete